MKRQCISIEGDHEHVVAVGDKWWGMLHDGARNPTILTSSCGHVLVLDMGRAASMSQQKAKDGSMVYTGSMYDCPHCDPWMPQMTDQEPGANTVPICFQ